MSTTDNPSHLGTLQSMHAEQPNQLKQQYPPLNHDLNRDPTLLSSDNPINQPGYQTNQPGYQTNQPQQPILPHEHQPSHHQTSLPPPQAELSNPVATAATSATAPTTLSSEQTYPQQSADIQQNQTHPPTAVQQKQSVKPSLSHQNLPAEEEYYLQKLRQPDQQTQPIRQQPFKATDLKQKGKTDAFPIDQPHDQQFQQKATESLPASTLNDPHHPDSLPTEYKVGPRRLHHSSDIEQYYKTEHESTNMSNNVAADTTTYRDTQLPDSGAKIPQHIKQADRNQKFKVFEILQAFVQGRLPTNAQLDQFLVRAMTSSSMESRAHMLSGDGKALYEDFKDLLQTLRGVIYEKNEQELFQNLLFHCQSATDSIPQKNPSAPAIDVGISSKKAKQEARQTLDSLSSVAKLVTTNSEFRTILSELIDLAREVFGEGANKLSNQAMVASERLSNKAQATSQQIADSTQNNQGRIQETIQSATDLVQGVIGQARDEDVEGLRATRDDAMSQGNAQYETAKKQAAETRSNLNKQARDMQGKAKERALQMQSDAKAYASEKMPPERRHALVERLKVIIGQVQADPQYQNAIESIMNLFGVWRQRSVKPTENLQVEAAKIAEDPNLNAATLEFKVLLQRWAQGYSLDPMIRLIQEMWHKTLVDPELNQYMSNLSQFLSKVVREPNYVTSQQVNADGDLLIRQGQALLNIKYRSDTEALVYESRTFLDKLNNDPRSREMSERFQTFAKHLLYDKKGRLKFKPHLFDDFRYVLLPSMMESFRFIPVPRIQYSDLKVDMTLDNMVLTSTDLLPRLFEIAMNNTIHMVPRGKDRHPQDTFKHDFKMQIEGVEANIHNLEYYINTKTGFRFTDRGCADILIDRRGIDIKIHGIKTPNDEDDENDRTSLITFKEVVVKINNLRVKIHESDHRVLFTFAQPFIRTAIKNAIAKAIEAQVREALVKGDKVLATSVRDQRIKTGKNTVGALIDTATSFVSNKIKPDEKTKASLERKRNRGHYNRTSHVIFDQEGLQVLDPVKHMELKVGTPLLEDPNAMAAMPVAAPWVSTAFNMNERSMRERETLPGVRRPRQGLAM